MMVGTINYENLLCYLIRHKRWRRHVTTRNRMKEKLWISVNGVYPNSFQLHLKRNQGKLLANSLHHLGSPVEINQGRMIQDFSVCLGIVLQMPVMLLDLDVNIMGNYILVNAGQNWVHVSNAV